MHFYKAILSAAALLAAGIQVGAKFRAPVATFPLLSYIGTVNINITAGQMIPVYGGDQSRQLLPWVSCSKYCEPNL